MPGEEISPRAVIPNLQASATPLCKHVHRKCGPQSPAQRREPEPSRTLLNGRVSVPEAKGEELGGSQSAVGGFTEPCRAGLKVGVGKTEGCALGGE